MIKEANKKFQIYNSLFLNLSYQDSNHVGHLLPLLKKYARKEISKETNPIQIIDDFWKNNSSLSQSNKIDFMFKVIQYVERQIVLFDSIEDARSPYDLEDQKVLRIDDIFQSGQDAKIQKQLFDKLNDFKVRIVLTAHPTQFYRPPVLDIIAKLRKQIAKNNIEKIDVLLHQLGLTSLVNSKSPTPFEEAKNIIHICRYYYYDAIGDFLYNLRTKFPSFENYELISLGFWPCGDRDGNPYVSHETTKDVIDELRMTLMKCYYNDLKELSTKLTFKDIEETLNLVRGQVYRAMFNADTIVDHEKMLAQLRDAKILLMEKYEGLYAAELDRLIVKINAFKSHFASLDIRQDHSVHQKTMEYILKKAGHINDTIDELDQSILINLLTREYVDIPELGDIDPLIKDTIQNIQQLPAIQKSNGEAACNRYIISNSEDIYSVLYVYGLMRWIYKSEQLSFDIIPLFETMIGMSKCDDIMDTLFNLTGYKAHVKSRSSKQTMMLGFSDGTKDGGYLKANWSIFKSKEKLSSICSKHGISAVFFDGRGGPPARGGGKTHNFYAALGPKISNDEIQMTIQGQTITSTYGTKEKFKFNAEQLITSGLKGYVNREHTSLTPENRELIEELSELSYEKYISLKSHPKFLPYLEKMTTLKYYSKAHIGSRPAKRNTDRDLRLSDLRAISYVGSWSQMKQNIPGYFGLGTALKIFKEANKLEQVKNLYQVEPFFKALIDNSMMSLTKCLFELTSYMKNNDSYKEFWLFLYEEYQLSKKMILEITGFNTLMQNEAQTKASIQTREDIVLPLIIIQNYALQKIQENLDIENIEAYKKLVIRSLYGNINASRNSA